MYFLVNERRASQVGTCCVALPELGHVFHVVSLHKTDRNIPVVSLLPNGLNEEAISGINQSDLSLQALGYVIALNR
jgi:hypothetical protein